MAESKTFFWWDCKCIILLFFHHRKNTLFVRKCIAQLMTEQSDFCWAEESLSLNEVSSSFFRWRKSLENFFTLRKRRFSHVLQIAPHPKRTERVVCWRPGRAPLRLRRPRSRARRLHVCEAGTETSPTGGGSVKIKLKITSKIQSKIR